MSQNIFTVLGSSSGQPQGGRACSGFALETGGSLSLIDCGGGVTSSFLRCGFDPMKVDRVFISHTHPDHVSDLPLFIQMVLLTRRANALDLFLPEEFVGPFEITMQAMYLLTDRYPMEVNLHGYKDGFVFEHGFRLVAIGNRHLTPLHDDIVRLGLVNKMQSHSFKIEIEGCKPLFYSADIDSLEDVKPHVTGCGQVLMELTHVDMEQFCSWANETEVERFVITHLGYPGEVEELRRKIKSAGLSNVELAEDGMKISI